MYAVVTTGGKQYRVQEGDTLDVERLTPGEDQKVDLRPVMLVGDDGRVTVERDALDRATVRAAVIEERKGPKLTVYKYKPSNRYRRKGGHRQRATRLRIEKITA